MANQKKWTDNYSKFDTLDSDDSDNEKESNVNKVSESIKGDEVSPTVSLDGSPVLHPTTKYAYEIDEEFNTSKQRVKSLPQNKNEVWQVTCWKLECWTALPSSSIDDTGDSEGGDNVIVRPWSVLIACIYPEEGRLLGYDVNTREPHKFPTAVSTVHCLLKLMLDPPFGNQRRPVLTFINHLYIF